MCVIVPLCVVLAILKKKKLGFFSIANPVLSYFQYIFAHCLTSKLRKIKKKDKEKINNLIRRNMYRSGFELLIPDAGALITAPWTLLKSVILFFL